MKIQNPLLKWFRLQWNDFDLNETFNENDEWEENANKNNLLKGVSDELPTVSVNENSQTDFSILEINYNAIKEGDILLNEMKDPSVKKTTEMVCCWGIQCGMFF